MNFRKQLGLKNSFVLIVKCNNYFYIRFPKIYSIFSKDNKLFLNNKNHIINLFANKLI